MFSRKHYSRSKLSHSLNRDEQSAIREKRCSHIYIYKTLCIVNALKESINGKTMS